MKTWLIAQRFQVVQDALLDGWRATRNTHGITREFHGDVFARTFFEVFDAVGLKASTNDFGDLCCLRAEAIDERGLDSFFRDIVPFVVSGSYLVFLNETGLRTVYTFNAHDVVKTEKAMAYSPDEDGQFE